MQGSIISDKAFKLFESGGWVATPPFRRRNNLRIVKAWSLSLLVPAKLFAAMLKCYSTIDDECIRSGFGRHHEQREVMWGR